MKLPVTNFPVNTMMTIAFNPGFDGSQLSFHVTRLHHARQRPSLTVWCANTIMSGNGAAADEVEGDYYMLFMNLKVSLGLGVLRYPDPNDSR